MSFKSVTERTQRKKKTEDINEYMRQYRLDRKEHLNNLDKCKYYKKKGLPQELIDLFGEHSGLVFKLKNQFQELVDQKPELYELIIEELLKIE
jgi:hypothetical protein